MDQSADSGSGTKIDDVDGGKLLKGFPEEQTSEDEYGEKNKLSYQSSKSEIKGRGVDDKEHLFEKLLTRSDVGNGKLNRLIIAAKDAKKYSPFAAVLEGTTRLLEFEDEDGKSWKFNCSYVSGQWYELTGGWSSYVKEKQLRVRDFVCFRQSRTDSSRLFISYKKDPVGHRKLRLHEVNMTGFNPVLVIFCGDNQDSEETYFISYIFNELCLHGFSPLRYDLTRSMVTGNQEMLYSSRVGIMIFSENYTRSRQYLDEVMAITDRVNAKNLVLIPVYFKVSLSDVSNQSGPFGRAFLQPGKAVPASQVQNWRESMIKITSINGYLYAKGDKVMLAKNLVRDICLLLSSETYRIKIPLESILPLLDCPQPSALQIVGLWGMAGIGKTTIAREIFRTQAERYDVCYFLPDFHLMCQTKGLNHLRDELFSKIFGEEEVLIDACDSKLSCIKDRLLDKKVLIILDDVSTARDVEVLVGGFGWFSGGHTIILTSRNRQVLIQCKVKELYEIPKLSKAESFRLCCEYASRNMLLISYLAEYASGIPLALRVLGLSVQKQGMNSEKEHMRRLRQHPPIEIQDSFRKSFDGLDENEKNIFLDIACFFRGEDKDHVVNILDGCGFFTELGICGLVDESLISLVENRIEMHNIFQDMGQFIVCQENEEGTEAIEGISLDASKLPFDLNPTVFERMYRLRLLKLHCSTSEKHCKVCLPQGLHSLPDELRLLHWERYPVGSLPRNFNPKNLVELNMPYSNLKKLWKGTKNLEKLKRIILSHSRELTKFPRLSKAMNLEHIDLEGCTSLVKVNSSILHHRKLTFLSLKDCSGLRIMPTTVHLESLEVLNLSGCSELEDIQDFSANLTELYLAGTAIREIPSSIGELTRLIKLDLENCDKLQHLPPEIDNLKATVTLSTKRPSSSMETKDISSVISSITNLSEVNDPTYKCFTGFSVLPKRPSQLECQVYMKGYCIRGDACRFQHTRNRETSVPESSLSSMEVSSSFGASSSELVQASTKKPRIDKTMASEIPHSSSELVQASTASEITQATVGRDTIDTLESDDLFPLSKS